MKLLERHHIHFGLKADNCAFATGTTPAERRDADERLVGDCNHSRP